MYWLLFDRSIYIALWPSEPVEVDSGFCSALPVLHRTSSKGYGVAGTQLHPFQYSNALSVVS